MTGLSGDRKAPELFFAFQNFTDPGSTYRCVLNMLIACLWNDMRRGLSKLSNVNVLQVTGAVFAFQSFSDPGSTYGA